MGYPKTLDKNDVPSLSSSSSAKTAGPAPPAAVANARISALREKTTIKEMNHKSNR